MMAVEMTSEQMPSALAKHVHLMLYVRSPDALFTAWNPLEKNGMKEDELLFAHITQC